MGAAVRRVSSLFLWLCGAVHYVLRVHRKALTVGAYYGWIPWALSIVIGSVSLSHSVSESLSLSLSPAAPRARQSALQPAWQLHNALCFPPVLFLRGAPSPPPLLLWCCCWVPKVHCASAPYFLISVCTAPAASLPYPSCPALSGNRLIISVFCWSLKRLEKRWHRSSFCMNLCSGWMCWLSWPITYAVFFCCLNWLKGSLTFWQLKKVIY